ncbi:hypothetical protein BDQ17DRAFT_1386973 [Cyathus striatus]|nr:hypothetical protein BDQ17DRAFT_1386973 [Cyathus striatus]
MSNESLNAFADSLAKIEQNPYDVNLHIEHIRLAQSLDGMEAELQSALEMVPEFLAVGEEVWLPLIEAKEAAVNLSTKEGVEELVRLYERAENDYLSIPILLKHVQFLINKHTEYHGEEPTPIPEELGNVFSTEWTRLAIERVVEKGIGHLMKSHLLWDARRDWEVERLQSTPAPERQDLFDGIQVMHLKRLEQPHLNSDETSQSYSSFTTNYRPPGDYENLMVAASKIRSRGTKAFERRERNEATLKESGYALESYAQYIASERRMRYPDLFVIKFLFERAIAEAAKRRWGGEANAEEVLRIFWVGYMDSLTYVSGQRMFDAGHEVELATYRRAVRSVPGSGEVWARYIRFLEQVSSSDGDDEPMEERETVADIYSRAFATNLLQSDVEQIVPIVLARAGYEKRKIGAGTADEDGLATLIGVLESGIEMVHQASKAGDAKLRLERYIAEIYQEAELVDNVFVVWQDSSKKYRSSYLVWTSFTDALIKNARYDDARSIFNEVHTKQIDWPEAIWEAWISFEHLHGSVEQIQTCLDKVEKAQTQLNLKRAKDAEKAAYQAMQMAAEVQANVLVTEAPISSALVPGLEASMDVDINLQAPASERGKKRSIGDELSTTETHKRARVDQKPPPLKRDRENTTIFVADLPGSATEDDLESLFKDCGKIREVKITHLPNTVVATVEFFDRDDIPVALTKDKKRIRDQEISVHMAWKSTLYVTNFPESSDDTFMRNLFGKYGTIFETRWPSKKFKSTRRFCYVQFTSTDSAQRALELHGRELEPKVTLNVYVSDPERRKERTDRDANEREVYVAGLSKFTTKEDLEKVFTTYGKLKEVRMATDEAGHSKGYAFVEFEEGRLQQDAQAALAANNHELKKRRIAVTLADPRVRSKHHSELGLSRQAETRVRSVRIRKLPPDTQEGLLQQMLEKIARVKRVEVFMDKCEAVVELENTVEAGKLVLRSEPITFNGHNLEVTEETISRKTAAPPMGASRPRAGLGHTRAAIGAGSVSNASAPNDVSAASKAPQQGKGQDDFRKMLGA